LLTVIVSLLIAGLFTAYLVDYSDTTDANCTPGEKTSLYPLTPGESYSDPGAFFNITLNSVGEGSPSARKGLDIFRDRFIDTVDEAYVTTWRNSHNVYCFTVYATPSGQRTSYLWMSEQVMSLTGLATPIPTP